MEPDLDAADAVMSAHPSARPLEVDAGDRETVQQFCRAALKTEQHDRRLKEARAPLVSAQKQARKDLADWIRAQGGGARCFVLQRETFRASEAECTSEGLEAPPPYLRLQRSCTDSNITPQVAETAVLDVDWDAVRERAAESNPVAALAATITDGARRAIRSQRETVALSASPEKGAKPLEIPELPPAVAATMLKMHQAAQRAKALSASAGARPEIAAAKEVVKRLEAPVASFLDRMGRTAQQIKLSGGGMHRIAKKAESQRAPKVTIKQFESQVSDVLRLTPLRAGTVEDLQSSFTPDVRRSMVKQLQLRLSAPQAAAAPKPPKVAFSTLWMEAGGADDDDSDDV